MLRHQFQLTLIQNIALTFCLVLADSQYFALISAPSLMPKSFKAASNYSAIQLHKWKHKKIFFSVMGDKSSLVPDLRRLTHAPSLEVTWNELTRHAHSSFTFCGKCSRDDPLVRNFGTVDSTMCHSQQCSCRPSLMCHLSTATSAFQSIRPRMAGLCATKTFV